MEKMSILRIGVHKLGFSRLKDFPSIDKNGLKTEVGLVLNAFKKYNYDISYVDTTLEPDENLFDIIYVFNGYENSTSSLEILKEFKATINYILTDTRFIEHFEKKLEYIDNFFVQSPRIKIEGKPTFNSYLQKLPIYNKDLMNADHLPFEERRSKIIFGGSRRNRADKIKEYLLENENADIFIRDKIANKDTRLPAPIYSQLLGYYKYGIVLIDPFDAKIGNITWRYFEYIANGIITFVDRESDPYNLILPKDDFLYVGSREELNEKIKTIENDKAFRMHLLEKQSAKINFEDVSGYTFIKSLLEDRERN